MSINSIPSNQLPALQQLQSGLQSMVNYSNTCVTSLGNAAQTADNYQAACTSVGSLADTASSTDPSQDVSSLGNQMLTQLGNMQSGQPPLSENANAGSWLGFCTTQLASLVQQAQALGGPAVATAMQQVVFNLQQAQNQEREASNSQPTVNTDLNTAGTNIGSATNYAQVVASSAAGTDVSDDAESASTYASDAADDYQEASGSLHDAVGYQGQASNYIQSALAVVDGLLTPAPQPQPAPPSTRP